MKYELMQFFSWDHLPEEKQKFSKPFGLLAEELVKDDVSGINDLVENLKTSLPDNIERQGAILKLRTVERLMDEVLRHKKEAVRVLLEAKDCAVRSSFMK